MSAPVDVDVAVVGAGFAGIGLGVRLARRRRESFVLLERAHGVGGTWRDNRYPGVACDVPSHLYSFSFRPKPDWSRVFAPGSEIHDYLRDSARDEGLDPHLRLGTEMQRARWDGTRWRIATSSGTYRARVLVVAAGRLSEPRIPEIPGLSDFDGPVFHSARWDGAAALGGRRVGVVGTGASAAQIVPALAGTAAHLVVFQRTPPWVVPRGDRAYTEQERRTFALDPAAERALREELFDEAEGAIGARRRVRPDIDRLRDRALDHLAAQVPDARLRARLRPDYEIGCKRIVISDDLYPALGRDDVTLEPSALHRVEKTTAVAASGAHHPLDALVLATGFWTTRLPFAQRIEGRLGLLADRWADGMTAHASTAVHGFPNMFVLNGPNASLGHNSAVYMIEAQIDHVLGALDHLAGTGEPLEVTAEAEEAYTREIDAMSADTVWLQGGCRSWYVDETSGRLTLLWPGTARSFRARNGTFDPRPYGQSAVSAAPAGGE
ncbi:cation diffusion facilitator CzcD-associated flavoprotein CzcO [Actinomycetospora succinea]|uniref:Cation diffusion facilitator CzcD-associated flavoprotein CzcO n=1 Tax=Actinomycetospora succinea TaxID=663603 RepID=A0A4R6UL52_9PSEU|nr:NAD(P)/FAD-dependent oxidoreductase [Actinomycetospora succinea]TDQ47738.1 cation diffusion facilitator CzcD-associated flavoprotein CzcO [Actinomycetospora succinea]